MSDEYRGETRVGNPSDGHLEDSENQISFSGRSYSVATISMDPRSILALESTGEFDGRSGSVLSFNPDSDDPFPRMEMDEWEVLNSEQRRGYFPPMGPSQYQD